MNALPSALSSPVIKTIALLTLSNVFMTFAWYAHLKELSHKPWVVAALISWGIALFLGTSEQVCAERVSVGEAADRVVRCERQ